MVHPLANTYTCGSSPNVLESRSCLLSSRLKTGPGDLPMPADALARGFVRDGRVDKECGDFQGRILPLLPQPAECDRHPNADQSIELA
jgi:hypothetical protein